MSQPPCGRSSSRPAHGDPLRPYAPLCADRLKISGQAHWDPVPFLSTDPDLQVACLEPDILLHGAAPPPHEVPDLSREKPGETLKLALKWAEKGLLFLKEDYSDQVAHGDCVRVFNCYKASDCDGQTGDRRSRNFRERALRGPSSSLPCGPVFLGMCVRPSGSLWHTGRTFIISSRWGRARPLRTHFSPLSGRRTSWAPRPSLEHPATPSEKAAAVARLDLALQAYESHRLLGSVEKNVRGSDCSRVAGAELDSSPGTRQQVWSPPALLEQRGSRLPRSRCPWQPFPALRGRSTPACWGGLGLSFCYRRPLMAVFQHAFALCPSTASAAETCETALLPRRVSDELVLAAALAPLAVAMAALVT